MHLIVKRFNCCKLVNLSTFDFLFPRNTVVFTSRSLWDSVCKRHDRIARGTDSVYRFIVVSSFALECR